jgi:hypothetical protein
MAGSSLPYLPFFMGHLRVTGPFQALDLGGASKSIEHERVASAVFSCELTVLLAGLYNRMVEENQCPLRTSQPGLRWMRCWKRPAGICPTVAITKAELTSPAE